MAGGKNRRFEYTGGAHCPERKGVGRGGHSNGFAKGRHGGGPLGYPEDSVPELNGNTCDGPAAAVVARVRAAASALGLEGRIVTFGSHASGLSTAHSDCDVSYLPVEGEGKDKEAAEAILQRFAGELPNHGFTSIVRVFQALIPILRGVDSSGMEVDLCVGNRLGYSNSKLIGAYCRVDKRVAEVTKLVKRWAKAFELVGSSDGLLNSYAYTLLTIYYLMHTRPYPVVPNLQDLASQQDADIVKDWRWGQGNDWDCKFWDRVELIPRSRNTASAAELLHGFFRHYLDFKWANHSVNIRCGLRKGSYNHKPDGVSREWSIEDPFDLRHNLASQCSKEGRQRILDYMAKAAEVLESHQEDPLAAFDEYCSRQPKSFMLRCRVHVEKVSALELVEALKKAGDFRFQVKFPAARGSKTKEVVDAFVIFENESDRRTVHRLNEETHVGTWQLRLQVCSMWALEDAQSGCEYETVQVDGGQGAAQDAGSRRGAEDTAQEAAAGAPKEPQSGEEEAHSEGEGRETTGGDPEQAPGEPDAAAGAPAAEEPTVEPVRFQ